MNKTSRLFFVLWLVIGGSIGSPQPCHADSVVTLKGEAELNRAVVRLSDVFSGVPKEIDRDIAQAPAPGKQVVYDVNVLTRLAQKYRLEWEPQGSADHVLIKTASTHITADAIREAVIRKVKASNPAEQKGAEIDVSFDNRTLDVNLPADQSADFTLNNFDYDVLNKRFHADLFAGGYTIPVNGRVTVKHSVPVLVRRTAGGTTLSAADIDWMLVPEDRINISVVTEADQLIGRELRRDTEGDELLHTQDVMQPRLVVRGSLVTMKIETPLLQVTAQGKALQDGVMGDIVRVTNTQSNRTIEGTVTGTGTVTINTVQRVAVAQ